MNIRCEFVDKDGDVFDLTQFEEGVEFPIKLRTARVENGEVVLTIEYLHGIAPCTQFAIISGITQVCNTALDDEGRCDRAHLHVD